MCVIVTFPTRLYVDYMLRFTYEHSCLYLGIVNPWICQRVGPRRYKILVSQKYCGQKVLLSPTYRSTRRQGTAMRTRHSDANKAQLYRLLPTSSPALTDLRTRQLLVAVVSAQTHLDNTDNMSFANLDDKHVGCKF